MKWFIWILSPLSLLFSVITRTRNSLYDLGFFKELKLKTPIIGVGNITVGGTGKTPHCEYIAKTLDSEYKLALLSKGYGRNTNNFNYVEVNSKAIEVSDEALQTKQNIPNQIVAVDHSRVNGIQKILQDFPKTNVFILDDAFQHRSIKIGLNILLTDYNNPVYKDFIMPVGKLRESRIGIKRADCIIVTKCPENLSEKEADKIENKLKFDGTVFFSKIKYQDIFSINDKTVLKSIKGKSILLITGIANSNPILDYLQNLNVNFRHLKFSDHYKYKSKDIKKIIKTYQKSNNLILTTEKDAQKLKEFNELKNLPVYYLKVTIDFLWNKDKFDKKIKDYVGSYSSN
jgi:tetraacyldisaccharide 4'-kinase